MAKPHFPTFSSTFYQYFKNVTQTGTFWAKKCVALLSLTAIFWLYDENVKKICWVLNIYIQSIIKRYFFKENLKKYFLPISLFLHNFFHFSPLCPYGKIVNLHKANTGIDDINLFECLRLAAIDCSLVLYLLFSVN